MMTKEVFLWHAKRGHGECFFALKEDAEKYRCCVKKILLTNYAFLLEDEYRSFYACELIKPYNDDCFFAQLLWKKLTNTDFDDYFTVDYLLNNLYFIFKRNKKIDYTNKIRIMLTRCLKKDDFSFYESKSIQSLLSLIIDLKVDIDYETIIRKHQHDYSHSNLDLSEIDYCYHLNLNKPKHDYALCDKNNFCNCNSLQLFLEQSVPDKEVYMLSKNLDSNLLDGLFKIIGDNFASSNTISNILKVIYYSNAKINLARSHDLIAVEKGLDVEQKKLLYSILSDAKAVIKNEDINEMDDWLFIHLALNNYQESYYAEIHKRIKRIKVNYCDSDLWFEVENSLIKYFRKKTIDTRLLKDLKSFLKKGLCSFSRYKVASILKKHGMLTENEKNCLSYDANLKTRKLFRKKR